MRDFLLRHPKLLNLWFPFLGAGIKVKAHTADHRSIHVEMKRTLFNQNYTNTHFGGSLFAMTDPFFMFMLLVNLGPDYIVWDKAGSIRFKRPGTTTARAHFVLPAHRIDEIREAVERDGVHNATFHVDITDPDGNTIASVERLLYVATKAAHKARLAARHERNAKTPS